MILSYSVYFTQPVALTLKMESAGGKWQAELSFISQHLVTILRHATEKAPRSKETGG